MSARALVSALVDLRLRLDRRGACEFVPETDRRTCCAFAGRRLFLHIATYVACQLSVVPRHRSGLSPWRIQLCAARVPRADHKSGGTRNGTSVYDLDRHTHCCRGTLPGGAALSDRSGRKPNGGLALEYLLG